MLNTKQKLASSETSVVGRGEDTIEWAVFASKISYGGHEGKAGPDPRAIDDELP